MKQYHLQKKIPVAGFILAAFFCLLLPSQVFGENTEAAPVQQTYREPATGIEMILVAGGCFEMGCGDWMKLDYCDSNATPSHQVCVEPFWMAKFEVTQAQWEKVMGNNPSDYKGGPDNPVEMVSWNDIQVFLERLNGMSESSLRFRLPTEEEWEYGARSGGKYEKYAGGNSEEAGLWHHYSSETFHKKGIQSWPVGQKNPNGLGLYDMGGNVSEWTSNLYRKNYEMQEPEENPLEKIKGKFRVFRGASYSDYPRRKFTTWRKKSAETWECYDLGFRLAADKEK
jgi:formylglycine-generating enzyme required for sulfatase activity